MNGGKTVKFQVHGVEHVDDLYGFTLWANVGEGYHITEEDGALLKLTWKKENTETRLEKKTNEDATVI